MELKSDIQLTESDLVEFQVFQRLRSRKALVEHILFGIAPPLVVICVCFWLLVVFLPRPLWLPNTLFPLLLTLPLSLLLYRCVNQRKLRLELARLSDEERARVGKYAVTISLEGVASACDSQQTLTRWDSVPRVAANANYGFVYTGPNHAIIIPRRCFPNHAAFSLFVKSAVIFHWNAERAAIANAKRRSGRAAGETTTRPAPAIPFPANPTPLRQNLKA